MDRKCLYCEIPIEKKKHGLVKFCSTQCRNKYYYQNKPKKQDHVSVSNQLEDDQLLKNNTNESTGNNLSGFIKQKQFVSENNHEWRGNISDTSRGILANDIIRFLEENYKTKTELAASEIKLENALNEINNLKIKNAQLETELEEDEEEEQGGILGAINQIPEWLQPALAGILKSEKVQKFIIGLIPDDKNNQ